MALKCKLRAFLTAKGLVDTKLIEGTKPKFPRSIEIRIFSTTWLGNWIIKRYLSQKKHLEVDINILGW